MILAKIDWLTFTLKGDRASNPTSVAEARYLAVHNTWEFKELGYFTGDWIPGQPQRFYKYSFENTDGGRVDVAEDAEKQGIRLVLSGSALSSFEGQDQRLLALALDLGFKVTRIDVAFDFFNEGVEIDPLSVNWNAYSDHLPKTTHSFISSSRGDTFTVGSRQSPIYARAYDKGLQTGNKMDWKRLELELKAEAPGQLAGAIIDNPGSLWGELVDRFRLWDTPLEDKLFVRFMDATKVKFTRPREQTNTEVWLRDQVLSAFKKFARKNEQVALEILELFAGALLNE